MIRSKFVAAMYNTQVAKCYNTEWDIKYHDKPDGIIVYNFTPGQMDHVLEVSSMNTCSCLSTKW